MPRLLYFVTEDWAFINHFADRAAAARDAGYQVSLITRVNADADRIRAMGIDLIPVDIDRSSTNPLMDLRLIATLVRVYRRVRPDVAHHFALKPILYGTIAAKCAGVRHIVNAPTGMGFVFSSETNKARLLRPWVDGAMRLLLNPAGSHVVLENEDDLQDLRRRGLIAVEHSSLIRGAGVSLERFHPAPKPSGPPVVVVVARMLRDKGIVEFVEAARLLRARGVDAVFRLVGGTDSGNPTSIDPATLHGWQREGHVEWLGLRSDVPDLLAASHIACLPSYREGLPKSLVEAASAGLPIVTTDVPGCRQVVRDGIEGLLVPVRDPAALAEALGSLIGDPLLRAQMGMAARARAVEKFSLERINAETLELYRSILTD